MIHAEALAPITQFLDGIGLPVTRSQIAEASFLPGVVIREGALFVDAERLGSPGDILHEAGHLAVTPARLRGHLDGDIDACAAALIADPELQVTEAEASQIARTEPQAIAWSYAAALAAGVSPACVFWAEGYGGQHGGAPELVMMQVAQGFFPGVQGLAHTGLCSAPPPFGDPGDPAPFPQMKAWLAV
ncbi:hypothetical protein [Oceanicaulis sp. MMSF_3324]|uniref:hypothetical protein n=1 Tax=Oceanicaulis sp. MMSF_3324 TaxID=3046702 RepID=UPI00273E5A90|nr:hypothetical protein [Oceanicaulis sp. MMSF_3324]